MDGCIEGWAAGWMNAWILPFGGTFVDRMGALERAQINIHDHWLRMLIFEGLPTTLGGILVDRVGADGRMDGWRPAWIDG